jgi:murein DD-endopeptidase MepM/ murein hydrolase activator NlpD
LKEAISQETVSDSSHSCIPEGNGCSSPGSSLKSAAMLGFALSVGASGALVSQAKASAAVAAPTTSETTEAFSSDSKASASTTQESVDQSQIIAFHTVESGESLWQIAQQHRVGLRDLKEANALPAETAIRIGQVLKVPGSAAETVTGAPQTLAGLADGAVRNSQPVLQSTAQSTHGELAVEGGNTALAAQTTATSTHQTNLANLSATSQLPSGSQANSQQANSQIATPTVANASINQGLQQGSPPNGLQVADASAQLSAVSQAEPVVTALATPSTFADYQVRSGDTLSKIASSLGTTSEALIRANALANPNVILAGDVLRVPSSSQANSLGKSPRSEAVVSSVQSSESERLGYLRNTAVRPEAARILQNLRNASPEAPASVGGEPVIARDLLGSKPAVQPAAESVDPYVANLLAEVNEIRSRSVQTSEVSTTENAATENAAVEGAAVESAAVGNAIESDAAAPRSPLVARTERTTPRPTLAERVSLSQPTASQPSGEDVDSELLAAAPLSPDAYIPAQRSSAPQVVSPDMPLLPSADEYLPEAPNRFDGYIWPARGTVTSGYGWRWGRMHRGVDVAGPVGTPVVAAASGVVEQAGWNSGGFGNLVEIRHPDGSMTRYAHNNRLDVSAGQTVAQGQQIGQMGSTGYSTGPHLHFELHPKGEGAANPVAFLPDDLPTP